MPFPVEKDAKEEVQLFLGNAGTAMRPLTAAVTAAGGNATYVFFFNVYENMYGIHGVCHPASNSLNEL
ncbi:hypothetical protein, partial [Vibrio vulnificus]|uniref:hypothetical protein n=1 Tax=Vibrio vulnificus TaxID=672 RepID=UPI0039B6BD08